MASNISIKNNRAKNNALDVNDASEHVYDEINSKFSEALLAEADLIARRRNGTSIDIGDLRLAEKRLMGEGKSFQLLLLFAGALIGTGLGGVVQNALEKQLANLLWIFSSFLVAGLLFVIFAFWRRR